MMNRSQLVNLGYYDYNKRLPVPIFAGMIIITDSKWLQPLPMITAMHYVVLHCSLLHWTELCCTALHCNLLHWTALEPNSLH